MRRPNDSIISNEDAWENYARLVIDVMGQRRISMTELSHSVGVDRSHLGKVRRGERPMTPRLLDDLIATLELDRQRMALAVGVLRRRELYDDPSFKNVSAFAGAIITSLLDLLQTPGRMDRASVFAAMSTTSCEVLATQSLRHVQNQFQKLELVLSSADSTTGE